MWNTDEIKKLGAAFESKLINYRRHLHQNAELSFEEYETNKWLHEKLENLNVMINGGIRGNSIVAVLDSGTPGPFIGFRADFDALPITECNGLAFASKNEGVMHACGHDAHAAILMCLAEVFSENLKLVKGKIAFIFQQGEEKLPGGARMLIEDGGLEGLDCIYALHVRTNLTVGQFDSEPGARSCAVQAYEIEIEGKGGHTGFPQLARDPIGAAAAAVNEIYQIRQLGVGPRETATLAVGYIHSNNQSSPNVYSQTVTLGGTIRTLSNDLLRTLPEMIEQRVSCVCEARGCKAKFTAFPGYAAVNNRSAHFSYVAEAGKRLGYENVPMDDVMGAEDFSYMLMEIPGAYFTIGVADPEDPSKAGDRHTPNLMIDERGLRVGFELMIGTYLITLEKMEDQL